MGKIGVLAFVFTSLSAIGFAMIAGPKPIFIWNLSPSVPTGLYIVRRGSVEKGEIAVISLPEPIARLARERSYLPKDIPALKVVFAVAGDRVCRTGQALFVNGTKVAKARKLDRQGRPMPVWSGCHRLVSGEVFLLNPHPESFDSRYFGPVRKDKIIGRAIKL